MKSQKELKEEYKQIKFKMGVFQIRNIINGKIFIDSNVHLDAYFNRTRMQLNFGNHPNITLQKEWKEFGEQNFRFEILAEFNPKEEDTSDFRKEVKLLEAMYLDELKPFGEHGYNKLPAII